MRPFSFALLVCGASIALGLFLFVLSRRNTPGQLVVQQSLVEWGMSPASKESEEDEGGQPRFILENVGGRAVRVMNVQSGCGCAEPRAIPETIKPGQKGLITVQATLPATGERIVPIRLTTDSQLTPRIELQLRLRSSRKPPYLLSATGDLAYLETDGSESREIRAVTVDVVGHAHRPPLVTSDLAFLDIGPPTVTETPHRDRNSVFCAYTYRVAFKDKPPPGTFGGSVKVSDPWRTDGQVLLSVYGQGQSSIKIIPAVVILDLKSEEDHVTECRFRVHSKREGSRIHIQPAVAGKNTLLITRVREGEEERTTSFSARLKPGLRADSRKLDFKILDDSDETVSHPFSVYLVIDGGKT